MPSEANFKDFLKIPKIRNLKLLASQLLRVSQSSHKWFLIVNSHFRCFCTFKIALILGSKKSPKMRLYDQVWSMWWLWWSQKLTRNKFEVSDFWNFEKSWKFAQEKRVFFTKRFSSLRRNKSISDKVFNIVWYQF